MDSENSKTSGPDRLLQNLTDKLSLKKLINMLICQTLVFIIHGKKLKRHKKFINVKYQLQDEMKTLNYLIDHILYQIFKTSLII